MVKQLPDFIKMEKKNNVEIYHHLSVGDKVHEYHTNLDGCGYIVSRANSVDEALIKAENILEIIKKTIF